MNCAVKQFVYREEDSDLLEQFTNEVFLMRELQHDNLVRQPRAWRASPALVDRGARPRAGLSAGTVLARRCAATARASRRPTSA